jgi:ketose-bisphosphate aldolase
MEERVKLVPMAELLQDASSRGYAVPAFCIWSMDELAVTLRVATELRAPFIIMASRFEFMLMSPTMYADCVRALMRHFSVPVALHLDHGESLAQVKACLDAGFTSVMLDYSARPFEENVAGLRQVSALAHPLGVTVEGELGHVGKADTVTMESEGDSTLTLPEDAARYVEETGVDALAVSIGNAHGQYTKLPQFDFARLAAVRSAVRVSLVLHGGSGTPDADLKRAIALGMAKVNVATDLTVAMRQGLKAELALAQPRWLPHSLNLAVEGVVPTVERWFRLTGADGRA